MITGVPGERPVYWDRAVEQLKFNDKFLSQVIVNNSEEEFVSSRGDSFTTLVRSIVGQQISVKAADAIWGRVAVGRERLSASEVLRAGRQHLRTCGLSERKAEYVCCLAERFCESNWTARLHELPDEEVVSCLAALPGIGRWTAEMFLMFHLLRPNVLPVDDLGLLRAMSNNYHQGQPLTREEAFSLGRRWEPWRSVATWFLWRSLDPVPVSY